MIVFQVIAISFALSMMYLVRIHRRKRHLEPFEYGMWFAVWIIFIYLTIFPQTVRGIAEQLHISRVFDLLVMGSLMVLVVLVFNLSIAYKRIEKKLEDLVRKRAIEAIHDSDV